MSSSQQQGKTPNSSPTTCSSDDDHPLLLEVSDDGAVDQVAETALALPVLEVPTLPDLQVLADTAVSTAETVLRSAPVRVPTVVRLIPDARHPADRAFNRVAQEAQAAEARERAAAAAMPPPAEVVHADEPVRPVGGHSRSSQLRNEPLSCSRKRPFTMEDRLKYYSRPLGVMGRCGCLIQFEAVFETDYDRARAVRAAHKWCDKLDVSEEDTGYLTLYDPYYKKGPPVHHVSLDPTGEDDDFETDAMHPLELQKTN
jgi:hypothetical protein